MSQVSCSVRVKRGRLDGLAVKSRRFRSLRSLHQRLWIFALFEDVFYLAVKPQVPFASLPPPAVMDVRCRRRRLLEIDVHKMCFLLRKRLQRPEGEAHADICCL